MAFMQFEPELGMNQNRDLESNYSGDGFVLWSNNRTTATYRDVTTGFAVTLMGERFRLAGNELTQGTVTGVAFYPDEGGRLATISEFEHKAAAVHASLVGSQGVGGLLVDLLADNDRIAGSSAGEDLRGGRGKDILKAFGGDDSLYANAGGDILLGGGGSDTFFFSGNCGRAIIKDFEIGLDGSHDTLSVRGVELEFASDGRRDTMVEFSDGSSVLLEGVKFRDVAEIDVDLIP